MGRLMAGGALVWAVLLGLGIDRADADRPIEPPQPPVDAQTLDAQTLLKNWEAPLPPERRRPLWPLTPRSPVSLDRARWGSPRLESQLRLYRQYLATHGQPPDLLIVGSSRSLQGIDPTVLARSLSTTLRRPVRVFNFGINGATAQVVRWLLMDLFPPDWLPRVVVWGDGSRAFNSGRIDRTFASIAASEGFRQLAMARARGGHPWSVARWRESPWGRSVNGLPSLTLNSSTYPGAALMPGLMPGWLQRQPPLPLRPEPELDRLGFLADLRRFAPDRYYQQFPKVPGRYDDMYSGFQLAGGVQDRAARQLITFARSRGIRLSFVNLPLSQDYLDPARLTYEREFQTYLAQLRDQGLIVQDWLLRWPDRHDYFADPSHINRYGAAAIALDLAQDAWLRWNLTPIAGRPAPVLNGAPNRENSGRSGPLRPAP
ncbi:hypothetical protein BCR12_15155 [Limnothrix sp. P13C2]|nr:hypothetical protein BCR12_15155 [Limnothrix sp. P13C2]